MKVRLEGSGAEGGAPLLRTTEGRTPKGRLPQAGDRETEHGSVSARRVAGVSKCVVSARTGHFGMEAMRELRGKGNARITGLLCDASRP